MARRSRKGYYVDGTFVVEGSELDLQLRSELKDPDAPSRTERKNASEELQALGEELITLRAELLAGLSLPDKLREAVGEARRLTSLGAKRRQAQFIGKLMRQLEPEALEAVRAALDVQNGQSAKDTLLLHRAEQWRDWLIAEDERLEQWLTEHPGTDAQQLRALIRQTRKDARDARPNDPPQRQGRAYRQIFALVRMQLRAAAAADSADQ
jgi:ribosome-associated protein